jgi:hypothetical protein
VGVALGPLANQWAALYPWGTAVVFNRFKHPKAHGGLL